MAAFLASLHPIVAIMESTDGPQGHMSMYGGANVQRQFVLLPKNAAVSSVPGLESSVQ